MKPTATLLAALSLATSLSAHSLSAQSGAATRRFTDPANLGDERVTPRDGRELPIDQGARGLQQLLRRLSSRASIMNIVAHPDDEDGGMLTLYSRGAGARVADLSLTRGEGGQNAMTGDFEDALGLLRTQELLSCDRYSGIDQFFGTEVDFGFSKTKEEAFAKWTHERVLYDVVRAIRIYRPLVLTATFIGGVTDGHGQHQVSGEIAQEAFKAAGDPKVFPELTAEGILPWQPLKVYARVPTQSISEKGLFDYATGQYTKARFENYVTGEVTTSSPSVDVVVHEGDNDPLLADADGNPRSYVQFARMGLAQQKSQTGPGMRPPGPGKFDVSYHRYGSMLPKDKQKSEEASFFDGIDTSLLGLQNVAHAFPTDLIPRWASEINTAAHQFDPRHPEAIAPSLAAALKDTESLLHLAESWNGDRIERENALHELRIKRAQLSEALALSLDVAMDATMDRADIIQKFGGKVNLRLTAPASVPPPVAVFVTANDGGAMTSVNDNGTSSPEKQPTYPLNVSMNLAPTLVSVNTMPYFYRDGIEESAYKLRESELRNAPVTPAPLVAWSTYDYMGAVFEVGRVVHSGPQAVNIVPSVSLSLSNHAQVLPSSEKRFSFSSRETPTDVQMKSIHIKGMPPSWKSIPGAGGASAPGQTEYLVEVPNGEHKPATLELSETLRDGTTYTEGYRSIGYDDLPRTNYYTPATNRIVPVDLKLSAARRIGYLPGTGDAVPEALASIGLKPEMLTVSDLTAGKLKQFDTVILGVRTYAAHADLHGAPTQALLEFAKEGGNVVVQYQTAEFTGDDAPYPLTLGRDAEKVVDETDPVRLIEEPNDPAQRLLVVPNRIHPEDFNGWVEERGHGFLRTWDNHYSAPTETHDPGEEPQRGGLVTVQLGKGRWTYLAFAVYRQLPEAVPGAYRLLVNLLEK